MHTVLATLDGQPIYLAQDFSSADEKQAAGSEKESTNDDKGSGGMGGWFFPVILGMMVIWIFLLGSGSRKQKKKQAQMIAAMSKGSKVITIGGIKGSVVEVRDDEVIVKVDENNNTRMKFSRDAIRTVVDESAPAVKEKDLDKPQKDEK